LLPPLLQLRLALVLTHLYQRRHVQFLLIPQLQIREILQFLLLLLLFTGPRARIGF
jgi:hypothetical protein